MPIVTEIKKNVDLIKDIDNRIATSIKNIVYDNFINNKRASSMNKEIKKVLEGKNKNINLIHKHLWQINGLLFFANSKVHGLQD